MDSLSASIDDLRKRYREIFKVSSDAILQRINELKPNINGDIFDVFEKGSSGYKWQTDVLKMFDDDICREIYRKWREILDYRSRFKCSGCGTCCKLACSEFSPVELKQKAENGDNFANQFLSVFVPYDSKEDARKIYPEYIKMLEENKESDVYFYHCPKLTEDCKCSDYGNRPQICRDFPDNPLALLPNSCGYEKWKAEVEPIALMLHSMLEIIEYYKNKIPVNVV